LILHQLSRINPEQIFQYNSCYLQTTCLSYYFSPTLIAPLSNCLASCRVFSSSNETALRKLIRFGSTDENIIDALNQAVLIKNQGTKSNSMNLSALPAPCTRSAANHTAWSQISNPINIIYYLRTAHLMGTF
jgi:hypothetical protein